MQKREGMPVLTLAHPYKPGWGEEGGFPVGLGGVLMDCSHYIQGSPHWMKAGCESFLPTDSPSYWLCLKIWVPGHSMNQPKRVHLVLSLWQVLFSFLSFFPFFFFYCFTIMHPYNSLCTPVRMEPLSLPFSRQRNSGPGSRLPETILSVGSRARLRTWVFSDGLWL